jgi:uncharacterized protein (TIGR03085 family)
MTRHAIDERHALADLLSDVGPDAPTLCDGWTTRDLAAHLILRERRPDASAGVVVPAFRERTRKVQDGIAARPYADLVATVRRAPWWSPISNPLTDELFNGTEFLVHHEDVRRGEPGWQPRQLSKEYQEDVFGRVRKLGRFYLRRLGIPLVLVAPGHGELAVGQDHPVARLTGEPVELLLFLTGRQRAARVEVTGEPAVVDRLRTARLGV